jgi:hypothetical protein
VHWIIKKTWARTHAWPLDVLHFWPCDTHCSTEESKRDECKHLRPYSKSSLALTLNEWRFNLSFSWVSMLFLNSWRVSRHIGRYDTSPPAVKNSKWHSREAQIELPLIEFECEWAFRIRALYSTFHKNGYPLDFVNKVLSHIGNKLTQTNQTKQERGSHFLI